jgi:hypothetical protein
MFIDAPKMYSIHFYYILQLLVHQKLKVRYLNADEVNSPESRIVLMNY